MNTSVKERDGNLSGSQQAAIAVKSPAGTNIEIRSILESVMVLGWPDVMKEYPLGLLHVEYRTGPDHFIQYLTVLSSGIRGYWQLVCEYWTLALWSHAVGLTFGKGYSSAMLAKMLEFVMANQGAFLRTSTPTHNVLLQISPPTQQETAAAKECMRQAIESIDDHTRITAEYNVGRDRFQRELELLHARLMQETIVREAATNEGIAEKPEAPVRSAT